MKVSLLKGTRDFGSAEIKKREYIFNTIKGVYKKFGFGPLETPSMESLSTLTGKYGEEGDALLFKILNNGDYLAKTDPLLLSSKDSKKLVSSISKRGLRYDLTVPFARYVVMNQHKIKFPFKRYQIQAVWRADRPQKGRYNEFYQCDADVIGSGSLICEAELMQIFDEVFTKLGINVVIKVNNRKVLYGIAEVAGITDQFTDMTVSLDKLDKIGEEKVMEEMARRGINKDAVSKIFEGIKIKDLDVLTAFFSNSETGLKGIDELKSMFAFLKNGNIKQDLIFDIQLARGLSYYTGCIFEVVSKDVEMGSLAGGGRYDDLTSIFGLKNVSGVGISFGAERLYDVMETLALFPSESIDQLPLLIIAMDQLSLDEAFIVATKLRSINIICDVYPEAAKMKKMMKYADDRGVARVLIIGDEERISKQYSLKDMVEGKQIKVSIDQLIKELS